VKTKYTFWYADLFSPIEDQAHAFSGYIKEDSGGAIKKVSDGPLK